VNVECQQDGEYCDREEREREERERERQAYDSECT
jgi:hypothetical protein